jgi:hypothetical protein
MNENIRVRRDDLEAMRKYDADGNLSEEFAEIIWTIYNSRTQGYIDRERFRVQASVLFVLADEAAMRLEAERNKKKQKTSSRIPVPSIAS